MALAAGHERTRSTSVPGRPPWSTGVHDEHRYDPVDRGKGTVDQSGHRLTWASSRLVSSTGPVDRRPVDRG